MTNKEYLKNLKMVFDAAVKAGDFIQALAILEIMREVEDK